MHYQESIRVLIAEDDHLVSEMIRGLLEDAGHAIVGEAADGLEAVAMTQSVQPDVVLMDIKMPDMDGIEASRRIYERCPTPVVILTAYETPELVKQASAAGVGAYLVKLPDAHEIERAITIAMARFNDMMDLRRLNAELQTRNEELDAFAHTVAHDLRDPLSLIIGLAEILRDGHDTISDEKRRHFLGKMMQIGHKMNDLMDALLLLAGVRRMKVTMRPLGMANIVAEALERLAHLIKEYQAEIALPKAWPMALGHAPWVEEVWVNYLSNAIKYGGRPPHVELGATSQPDGMICFWVRDNGLGLTPEEQAELFMPFTRLGQTLTDGYGLGLSIARRIVEKLNGQVGVESKVGEGSIFTFTLPDAANMPANQA